MRFPILILVALAVTGPLAFGQEGSRNKPRAAEVSSLKPGDIREFAEQPEAVQQLLSYALGLTKKKLGYRYGSCDPANGGMDCSGTVHHILNHCGANAPRQANTLYLWVQEAGNLRQVRGASEVTNPQLADVKPGDLLFWEGTYNVAERNPPTSHVMIFVGHKKSDGKPVMVGASSGRYYEGKARHGVSLFDFRMPSGKGSSRFVGYGPIPGLEAGRKKPGGFSLADELLRRLKDLNGNGE